MYVFYLAVKIRNILVVSVFNVINDVMFNDNESVFWLLHREMSHQPHKASPNVNNTLDFKKSLKDWQMHFFLPSNTWLDLCITGLSDIFVSRWQRDRRVMFCLRSAAQKVQEL